MRRQGAARRGENMYERERGKWPEPNRLYAVIWGVCVLSFWFYVLTDEDGYYGILDNFNLVIHEGGHFIFMFFGRTMHFLGGTLLQCLLPAACVAYFHQTRQPAGMAFSGLWLGENFLNVARYISDAQDMALPLVGGGMHDWNTLLGGTFLLRYCRGLGSLVALAGWAVMIGFSAWYIWRNAYAGTSD